MEEVDITVNELAKILAEHFKVSDVCIESAEIADITHQHNPQTKVIGVGGVLTLRLSKEKV